MRHWFNAASIRAALICGLALPGGALPAIAQTGVVRRRARPPRRAPFACRPVCPA